MRVVFDGACLGDGPITGVGRAFLNALAAYAERPAADCLVLLPGADASMLPARVRAERAPRGALRRQIALPRLLRRLGAAVLHSSVASVPLRAPCPAIATVHDLPWLHEQAGERSTWWRRFATRRSLRAAAAVIAPSTFTLEAAARLLGDRTRLHLIPHGTIVPAALPRAARTGPFVVLGDDRPRKNRDRVRQAHALAAQRCPGLPGLRFVGPPDDYVDEATKARLLRECRACVQCSSFEGFGMPVLEALAHGAPLVCSDIPPFREIAMDAALFVDPFDVESIARGLVAIAQREAAPPPGPRPEWHAAATAAAWADLHASLGR